MALPTDSTHLSAQDSAEMIEQYGGKVDSQYAKTSMMRSWINVRPVVGTDTIIDRRVGKTVLKTVTPGVRPDADPTEFGRASLTVDTLVLARDNRAILNEFQTDFNARMELGRDHGKEMGKLFDQSMLIAGIKGAAAAAPAGLNGAFGAGFSETLTTAGDETDPDLFYEACARAVVAMQLNDMDTDEAVFFVNPTQHDVLLNHCKLIDRDFSKDNGDFADGTFKTLKGVPVVMTNRLPTAAITDHPLSNTANSSFYDVTAAEARTKALLLHPDALLVGETIGLSSDVYYERTELQWFIDSWHAFGANFKRPDGCARIVANV